MRSSHRGHVLIRLLLAIWLASQALVAHAQAAGGTKPLYLWSSPDQRLSRIPPSGTHRDVRIDGAGGAATWTLSPLLQADVSLQPGSIPVTLWLANSGSGRDRALTVSLANSNLGTIATAGPTVVRTPDRPDPATPFIFTLNIPSGVTAPAGSSFTLTVRNETTQANRRVHVYPISGGNISRVELQSATVINVESVQAYDAPYPGGVLTSTFTPGATVYVRSVVSDPFGSLDIAGAWLEISDPAAALQVPAAPMTQVADSGAATRTYEYPFASPADAATGDWEMRVEAREGTENTVTDVGLGTFNIARPALQVHKLTQVLEDPVNAATNPKRIPGSVQYYAITVRNMGAGSVDAGSLVIVDPIPAGLAIYVSTAAGAPVDFIDGSPASGLTFNYSGDVSYSNQPGGGPPYTYGPVADADGFDGNVTGVRITPTGTFNGASAAGVPAFTVRFRVRID